MDTVNQILMMVLCVMIGFAIGNVWGKETMKRTFSDLIQKLTDGIKTAASQIEEKKKEE